MGIFIFLRLYQCPASTDINPVSYTHLGKIGCVITKDLSRLGRNYIEAGSYIEIFFPKHNVRYIAVTDGVDSLTRQEMDITPFKNCLLYTSRCV